LGPPQGWNINIHPFVSPEKGVEKKKGAPHINKNSSPPSALMLFFTETGLYTVVITERVSGH
jgi:hypothetical protein